MNTFHIQKSNCDIYAAISRILKYDPLYHVNKELTRQSAISEPKTATIGKTYKRLFQLMRCRLYLLRHCYTTNLVVVIGKVSSEFNIKEHDGEKVQIFNIQIVDGNNNIEQTIICPAEILSKANTKIEIGDTIAIVGKLTNKKIVNNKQTVRKNIIYAKKVF